ncbi:hypothetical protein PIB30_112756, partial [Stylosanthes scabra]|nr:hypothetical protein [Stylosanthes scabra]
PIEECKAISLRSGNVVGDETTQNDEEDSEEDMKQKEVPALSSQASKVKEYEPKIPFPQGSKDREKQSNTPNSWRYLPIFKSTFLL